MGVRRAGPRGPASAGDAEVTPDLGRFGPATELVVKLIEEAAQDKCVPVFVEQLRKGLPYRQLLAALYLAAIRAARWHGDGIHGYDHSAYRVHSAYRRSRPARRRATRLPAPGYAGAAAPFISPGDRRRTVRSLPPALGWFRITR